MPRRALRALVARVLVATLLATRVVSGCTVDADCGLLGDCVGGACVCDAGWVGSTCATLDLVPAPVDSGLRQRNSSNWCGAILRDPTDATLFHSLNADFGGCANGLGIWLVGSRVIHSTARGSPLGPYTPSWGAGGAEVAVAAEAHNPQAVRAPDGTYLLFDSYAGPDADCPLQANYSTCHGLPGGGMCAPKMAHAGGPGRIVFHAAPAPTGPWTPVNASIDYPCFSENLTPSPFFHPNGTLFVVFHCDTGGAHAMGDLVMVRADTYRGPFARVNDGVWSVAGVGPHPEDPFFWIRTSPTTGAVSYHVILHNRPRGIHLYSSDGLTFTLQNALVRTEPQAPFVFNETITQTDGSVFTAGRRERPWILFAAGTASTPEVLVTSMQAPASVWPVVFTHAQGVRRAGDAAPGAVAAAGGAAAAAAAAAATAAATTAAAVAPAAVAPAAVAPPSQFHLAVHAGAAMSVSFRFDSPAPVQCTFGPAAAPSAFTANTSVRHYWNATYHHHAVLLAGALGPSVAAAYSCAGSPSVGFTTPPAPGATGWSFLSFADWGYLGSAERGASIPVGGLATNWSAVPVRQLIERLVRGGDTALPAPPSLITLHGDIGYWDDSFGDDNGVDFFSFTQEAVTDAWFAWVENVTASLPLMVSVGNHESECHSFACILDLEGSGAALRNFSSYNARWNMPGPASGGVQSMWFSYDVGGVHFVGTNTETDWAGAEEETTGDSHVPWLPAGGFAPPGAYMAWLAADLRAAAANPAVKYIVATGHRPLEDLPATQSAALVALFAAAQVDYYLCGHGHTYIRYDAAAFGDGAVHIMPGASGSDETPWPADQMADPAPRADAPGAPARCAAWCTGEDTRAALSDAALGAARARVGLPAPPARRGACHMCSSGGSGGGEGALGLAPVAATDLYSLGVVNVTDAAMTFTLLRAPDGAVLDTVTVARKQRGARRPTAL